MSPLVRLLYQSPPATRSPAEIVRWWESRRVTFNISVGITGVITMVAVDTILALPPHSSMPGMFLPAILAYGIAANIFYTLGWIIQIAFNAWWKDDPPEIGTILFRQGLLFSVGLTLLPVAVAFLDWGVRVMKTVFSIVM